MTEYNCTPGKRVLVTASDQSVKSLARVIYCQPLDRTRFALGLHLVVRVEEWG